MTWPRKEERLLFRVLLPLLLIVVLPLDLPTPTTAGQAGCLWGQSLNLVITGNTQGNIATWSALSKPLPGPAWQVLPLLGTMRRQARSPLLIIDAGNLASWRDAGTVLGDGQGEEILGTEIPSSVQVLGPLDLSRIRNRALTAGSELRRRIWTNLDPGSGLSPFPDHQIVAHQGRRLLVLSLISPGPLTGLPLQRWGDLSPEDPVRALNRVLSAVPGYDLAIIFCHLAADDLERVQMRAPPSTLLVRVLPGDGPNSRSKPVEGPPREFFLSDRPDTPGQARPVDPPPLIDLPPGGGRLISIRLSRTLQGVFPGWRGTVRALPVPKPRSLPVPPTARDFLHRLRQTLVTPACSLTTDVLAPPGFYALNPNLSALLLREAAGVDVALTAPPPQVFHHTRIISLGHIPEFLPNSWIQRFDVPGAVLQRLFFLLGRGTLAGGIGCAGMEITFTGGSPSSFQHKGRPMDAAQRFTLATDDSLPSFPAVARLLAPYAARSDSGLTLWDAWIDRLPRFRQNPATLLRDDFRR